MAWIDVSCRGRVPSSPHPNQRPQDRRALITHLSLTVPNQPFIQHKLLRRDGWLRFMVPISSAGRIWKPSFTGSILMKASVSLLPAELIRGRGKRGRAGIYEPPPNLVSKNKFSFSLRVWHILNFCSLLNMNSLQRLKTQAGFFLCF